MRPDRLAWLYRSLALTRLDQERWTEAAEAYSQAIYLSPGLASDQVSLAIAYQHQGKIAEAIAACQQAIVLLPCDANAHGLLGSLYRQQGRAEEALKEYQEAAKYDPHDFLAWHAIGELLDEQGKPDEAKAAYEKAAAAAQEYLERNPGDATVTYLLGVTYYFLGYYQQAITFLQKSVELSPDAASHYALGNAYYDAQDYAKALVEYQAALTIDPEDVASLVGLGNTCDKLGKTDEAIAAYRRALALKDDADIHYSLAVLLERQGQADEALAEYQASLRVEDNVLAHLGLASLYERTGHPDQAIAEYQAALKLSDDAETHVALAKLYEAQGQLEDAATEYQAAVERFEPGPNQDANRVALASVLLKLCRPDEALAALQAPLLRSDVKPSVEIMVTLAAIYQAQGKMDEAGEVYAALVQDNPDLPGVHYWAAWFAYRQNRLADAIKEMEQAVKLAPAFSLAWSALGAFFDLQGDLTAAAGAYEKALQAMPSNVYALLGLGEIALQQDQAELALSRFEEVLQQQPEFVRAVPDETNNALFFIHLDLALAYERSGRAAEAAQELATVRQLAETTVSTLPTHPLAHFQLAVAYWLSGETTKADAAFAEAARCDASLAGERERVEERVLKLKEKRTGTSGA